MPETGHIDRATTGDLAELAVLRLAQGWHANRPLLEALLDWEQARIFVLREQTLDGASNEIIATTVAIACGDIGIIGNVIVRANHQRRGLGRLLMEQTLAWLGERGVRSVLLDATIEGRPLYRRLGFVERAISWFADGTLAQLRRTVLTDRADDLLTSPRPAADVTRLAALDAAAFGGDRLGLLARMLRQPGASLYITDDVAGQPLGYALVRPVERANVGVQIGPWVARSERAAAALLRAAIGAEAAWREWLGDASEDDITLHIGMSGLHDGAMELCDVLGLRLVEDDVLMQLDLDGYGGSLKAVEALRRPAEHPEWVYGWLAPMAF